MTSISSSPSPPRDPERLKAVWYEKMSPNSNGSNLETWAYAATLKTNLGVDLTMTRIHRNIEDIAGLVRPPELGSFFLGLLCQECKGDLMFGFTDPGANDEEQEGIYTCLTHCKNMSVEEYEGVVNLEPTAWRKAMEIAGLDLFETALIVDRYVRKLKLMSEAASVVTMVWCARPPLAVLNTLLFDLDVLFAEPTVTEEAFEAFLGGAREIYHETVSIETWLRTWRFFETQVRNAVFK